MKSDSGLQSVEVKNRVAHPVAYRVLVAGLLLTLVATCAALSVIERRPSVSLLLFFALLVVVTENRDRLFGDETSVSSSMVVVIAGIVAFRSDAALLGPTVCAACGGLYWPHIRERSFAKTFVNASVIGLSAFAAASTFAVLTTSEISLGGDLAVALVAATVAYWVINTLLLATALALLRGPDFAETVRTLVISETPLIGFAVIGGLGGYLMARRGVSLGIPTVVASVVATDLLMVSVTPRLTRLSRFVELGKHAAGLSLGSVSGFAIAAAVGLLGALVVVPVAAALFVGGIACAQVHQRTGRWDLQLAFGLAIVELPAVVASGFVGIAFQAGGPASGLVSLAVAMCGGFVIVRWLHRRTARADAESLDLAVAIERAVLEGRTLPSSHR